GWREQASLRAGACSDREKAGVCEGREATPAFILRVIGNVRGFTVVSQALGHLPTQKPRQDEQQLGRQVGERGLDLLLGPGGIALLQRLKAETGFIVVDEGEVGVALRRLPEGAI